MIKIYNFLLEYLDEYGYPPSVREICEKVQIKSTATVYLYLEKLKDKGYITKRFNKNRALSVSRSSPYAAPSGESNTADYLSVPVVGKIAAGEPLLAIENIEEYYPVSSEFSGGQGEVFILRVKGSSMIDAGIFDGDKIIVKKQDIAESGQIIAALVDDSATIKRYFNKNGKIILHPENKAMQDIFPENLTILGLVIGLIRKF